MSDVWFTACIKNDVPRLIELSKSFKNARDKRPSDPAKQIFQGFTALHYACYFNCAPSVLYLLNLEADDLTNSAHQIQAPGFSKFSKCKLHSNSSCLQIALLRASAQSINCILQYIDSHDTKIEGNIDDSGFNNLVTASMCHGTIVKSVFFNQKLLQTELPQIRTGNFTPVMNAAYYGRPLVAAIFVKLSQQKEFQEFIFKQLLTRDEQKLTCIEICQSEIDYVKYGTSLANKKQVIQQYRKLMRRAFTWAESKGYKVDDFLKKESVEEIIKGGKDLDDYQQQLIIAKAIIAGLSVACVGLTGVVIKLTTK
ncbi:Ankyrin_repeat protein 1 [Hexamita inflata]|uniref:Ankyrin repeat protein 1 n=1 Tax=Hexamita inflata TaxID=28002 RepID=A0AA86TTX1_9EUKA|nr:Ankyrin repeat protein 1 [Hexamita inflata]